MRRAKKEYEEALKEEIAEARRQYEDLRNQYFPDKTIIQVIESNYTTARIQRTLDYAKILLELVDKYKEQLEVLSRP